MKTKLIDQTEMRTQLEKVFKDYGLKVEPYHVDKAFEEIQYVAVNKVLGEFSDRTKVNYSDEDRKELTKINGEKGMVAYLDKKYPEPGTTVIDQVLDALRLRTPDYFDKSQPGWQPKAVALFAEELEAIHAKALTGRTNSTYDTSRTISILREWITGEPYSHFDGPQNGLVVLNGFNFRSFANGRLDIFVHDAQKRALLLDRFRQQTLARFKSYKKGSK